MIHDVGNLRFSSRPYHPQDPDNTVWLIDVSRISDGHWLPRQMWFDHEPTVQDMADASAAWMTEYPGKDSEPPIVHCLSCNAVLVSDTDTAYGFDNALWIGFHGGYGMFIDACDFPLNTAGQWLRDADGEYLLGDDGQPILDPSWEPEYREERVLPGRPDHEAVICHECAHALCEREPWLFKLLNPPSSHAHRQDYHDAHPDHVGWDYEMRKNRES